MKYVFLFGVIFFMLLGFNLGIHLRSQTKELKRKGTPEEELNNSEKNNLKPLEKAISKIDKIADYAKFSKTLSNKLAGLPDENDNLSKLTDPLTITYDYNFRLALIKFIKEAQQNFDVTLSTEPKATLSDENEKLWEQGGLPLIKLKVSNLFPTQNEISLEDSLDMALKYGQVQQYAGSNDRMILSPIVTYKKTFVIDGHHRWSQLYLINPDAEIVAYDISEMKREKQELTPVEVLKEFQKIIGAYFGVIPSETVKSTNIYNEFHQDGKEIILSQTILDHLTKLKEKKAPEIKEQLILDITKIKELENAKNKFFTDIENNIKKFITQTWVNKPSIFPDIKRPSRQYMPQTGGPSIKALAKITSNDLIESISVKSPKGEMTKTPLPSILKYMTKKLDILRMKDYKDKKDKNN